LLGLFERPCQTCGEGFRVYASLQALAFNEDTPDAAGPSALRLRNCEACKKRARRSRARPSMRVKAAARRRALAAERARRYRASKLAAKAANVL